MKHNSLLLTLVTSSALFLQGCTIPRLDADKQAPKLPAKWQTEFASLLEVKRDISYYLMDYCNWQRPNTFNEGLAPAKAERL